MKVGLLDRGKDLRVPKERFAKYCLAIGVRDIGVFGETTDGLTGQITTKNLRALRDIYRDLGLSLSFVYGRTITLKDLRTGGQEIRKEVCTSIEALGKLDVGIYLQFVFADAPQDPNDLRDAWQDLITYYREIVRAACANGVKIASHPPQSDLCPNGLLSGYEATERLLEEVPQNENGVAFCMGCYRLFGDRIRESIQKWAKRIHYVHARDLRVRDYKEVRFGAGDVDIKGAIQELQKVGYTGLVRPEHYPEVEGETGTEISSAYAVGYLQALLT